MDSNLHQRFCKKSLTSHEMKEHFCSNFKGVEVDWHMWLSGSGLPKWNPNDYLDQTLNTECKLIVSKWLDKNGELATQSDIKWYPVQTMVFLDYLINSKHKFEGKMLSKMESLYEFGKTKNVEILFRWLMLNLCSDHLEVLPEVEVFVSKHGRGIYLRPLYNKLLEMSGKKLIDLDLVKKIYGNNRDYYHSVIKNTFDKKLYTK